jgi:hypothetical protein
MSAAESIVLSVAEVESGDLVLDPGGRAMRVLASYCDVGAASSGASTWCVEGYVAGFPTSRIRCAPDYLVTVLR